MIFSSWMHNSCYLKSKEIVALKFRRESSKGMLHWAFLAVMWHLHVVSWFARFHWWQSRRWMWLNTMRRITTWFPSFARIYEWVSFVLFYWTILSGNVFALFNSVLPPFACKSAQMLKCLYKMIFCFSHVSFTRGAPRAVFKKCFNKFCIYQAGNITFYLCKIKL